MEIGILGFIGLFFIGFGIGYFIAKKEKP